MKSGDLVRTRRQSPLGTALYKRPWLVPGEFSSYVSDHEIGLIVHAQPAEVGPDVYLFVLFGMKLGWSTDWHFVRVTG